METAQNIGMSAGLLDHMMEQYIIESHSKDDIGRELMDKHALITSCKTKTPDKK